MINWKQNSHWIYMIGLTIIGIVLRVLWVLKIPTKPLFDFQTYQDIATNIYNHQGHSLFGEPVAWQGMGYPTLLGYVYRIVGSNDLIIAKMLNVLLSSLTLVIFYLILIKLTDKKYIIFTAYTTLVFLPNYIAYNNVIGTEALTAFLLCVIVYLQIHTFDNRYRYALLGIVIGIAALTKPFFIAYPVIAAITIWLQTKHIKKTAISFITMFLVMSTVIAPWTYRNYEKYDKFIPISYNSGSTLFWNNNDNNTEGAWMPLDQVPVSPELQRQINDILQNGDRSIKLAYELDPILKEEAKKWIVNNPMKFIELGLIRLKVIFFGGAWDIHAWAMNEFQGDNQPWTPMEYKRNMNFIFSLTSALLYMLSTFGLIYVFMNVKHILLGLFKKDYPLNDAIIVLTMNLAFFMAVYFVYEGQPRYNYPILFLLVICTAFCLDIIRRGLYEKPLN